jgi:hypothetical protein
MTGKTSSEVGRKAGSSYASLYDDSVRPEQMAHARSVLVDIAEAGAKAVKAVADRGKARTVYGASLADIDQDYDIMNPVPYGREERISLWDYIKSRPVSQKFLRWLTGKDEYVYGASKRGGEHDGTYIDEGLAEKADRGYVKNYVSGVWGKAKQYASEFIEAMLTGGHEEDGHYEEGYDGSPEGERLAEKTGFRRLWRYLKEGDPLVEFAFRHDGRYVNHPELATT